MAYLYDERLLGTLKKSENLPFAAAWMDLEDIMLNEISQTNRNAV